MTDDFFIDKELERCLPRRFIEQLYYAVHAERIGTAEITELRLRTGRLSSLTAMGRNIPLEVRLTDAEMSECVSSLCHGSVYAHSDTIRAGYIRFGGGVRIGVCGTLAAQGRGVREITSLNIRLPHIIRGVCEPLMRLCYEPPYIRSILIYSPPGIGKTTLLRDIAARLGGECSRRTAVIDSRGELYIDRMFDGTLCDFLIGYPRASGIEIATRTLSPEVLICDELGDLEEARQILSAQNTGVPMIASAHASNIVELLSRPNIRMLHDSSVFAYYVGVSRELVNGRLGRCCRFDAVSREEYLCTC